MFKNIILCLILLILIFLNGCGTISKILSEGYEVDDFNQTRWGYTQEMVEIAELKQDSKLYLREGCA